jgi:hypothetical protein
MSEKLIYIKKSIIYLFLSFYKYIEEIINQLTLIMLDSNTAKTGCDAPPIIHAIQPIKIVPHSGLFIDNNLIKIDRSFIERF